MKGYLDAKELESYKKEDLQELAKQLGVDAEGTKKEIATRCAAVEVDIYQYYAYSLAALLAGGYWYIGANCGARAVNCTYYPWNVDAIIGARGACDSL